MKNQSVLYILLSVAELLFLNRIIGIIALVFSIIGAVNYNCAHYPGAEKMWRYAKITLLVGVGLLVIAIIGMILGVGLMGIGLGILNSVV